MSLKIPIQFLSKNSNKVFNKLESLTLAGSFIQSTSDNLKNLEIDALGMNLKNSGAILTLLLFDMLKTKEDLAKIKKVFSHYKIQRYYNGNRKKYAEDLEVIEGFTIKNIYKQLDYIEAVNQDLIVLLKFLDLTRNMPINEDALKETYTIYTQIKGNKLSTLDLSKLLIKMPHLQVLGDILEYQYNYFNNSIQNVKNIKQLVESVGKEVIIENSSKDAIFDYFVSNRLIENLHKWISNPKLFQENLIKKLIPILRYNLKQVDMNDLLYHMTIDNNKLNFKLTSNINDVERAYYELSFIELDKYKYNQEVLGENGEVIVKEISLAEALAYYAILNNIFNYSLSSFAQFIPSSILIRKNINGESIISLFAKHQRELGISR